MIVVHVTGEGRNVGKTLLGERLARLLSARGLRVAAVKHVHHGVDYRVKDTGRYLAAGAERVVAIAPGEYMLVERREPSLYEVLGWIGADAVIVEGFAWEAERLLELGACRAHVRRDGLVVVTHRGTSETLTLDEAPAAILRVVEAGGCRLRGTRPQPLSGETGS